MILANGRCKPAGEGITGLFSAAIQELANQSSSTPRSFKAYATEQGYPNAGTADAIYVDSLARLNSELRDAGAMVFRLGSQVGERTTRFALAKHAGSWTDFFLFDDELTAVSTPELFIPSGSVRDLYAFQLLPALTEVSLVNLALASGLLGHALRLDDPARPLIPATGQSTFDFQVRPHAAQNTVWAHERGQVELDALFVGRRSGRETLFVVEAKCSEQADTIAKHKLVYPVLAIQPRVPKYLLIVPVYLRVLKEAEGLRFVVTECRFQTDADALVPVSSLEAAKTQSLMLYGFSSTDAGSV